MCLQQSLGFRLRQHQSKRIRILDLGQVHMTDGLAAGNDVCSDHLVPSRDESVAAAGAIEQFQSAAPDHQGLGLVGSLRRLVHDAHGHAVAGQLCRHRQSDRAGADNQNLRVHMFFLHWLRSSCSLIIA